MDHALHCPATPAAAARGDHASAGVLLAASACAAEAVAEARVTIDDFSFSPAELAVAAVTRVTWTNRDDIPRATVDRDDPRGMKSPPMDTGESFASTFERPGVYHYFCSLHPHMQGTVIVR